MTVPAYKLDLRWRISSLSKEPHAGSCKRSKCDGLVRISQLQKMAVLLARMREKQANPLASFRLPASFHRMSRLAHTSSLASSPSPLYSLHRTPTPCSFGGSSKADLCRRHQPVAPTRYGSMLTLPPHGQTFVARSVHGPISS
eukprot:3170586-Pleurochrysis_carterae.AAC.1